MNGQMCQLEWNFSARNGNIVTPLCVSQNPFLGRPTSYTLKPLGSIGKNTKDNFINENFNLW